MFISFEGGEGCGKTTHLSLLAQYLRNKGQEVVVTREPGGTAFGKQLRKLLLAAQQKISDHAEIFLFAADRAEHVKQVIKPALAKGKIVLCDRYIDSTYAYQVGGRGLPEDFVNYLILTSSGGVVPALTFFLDLPVKAGLQRVASRSEEATRFELLQTNFHEKVRAAFLKRAKEDPKRIKIIDSSGEVAATNKKITKLVKEVWLS